MKRTKPAHQVTICDVCEREVSYVSKCKACGGDYCLLCNATMTGCVHHVDVCRICGAEEEVRKIVENHASEIQRTIDNRDLELLKLRGKESE